MSDPLATITNLLAPVFADLNGGEPSDPTVRPSDRADAQINGALPLAKRIGANPRDLAQKILDSGVLDGAASTLEVAGPGFVNVTFSPEFLAVHLAEVAGDDRLGVSAATEVKTVVVDYSAPNVAKEMHVGHLRTTLIGDALVRMLDFLGHRVIRENHIGDWGTPFGMLIEHLVDLGEERAAEHLSLGDLDGFYKEARTAFDASEEFQDRARQRVVLLQGGDAETQRLWALLVELSTKHFNTVYEMLGVHLTDDDLAGESSYQPLMPEVIERLRSLDLLTESDGRRRGVPARVHEPRRRPASAHRSEGSRRVQLRDQRPCLCHRSHRAARGGSDPVCGGCGPAAALPDGVRRRRDGGMAGAAA